TESHEATYEGIFNINVETDPHEIDIDFVAGPEAGNRNFGIFRLDGDGLEICLDMNGKTRPKEFRSTGGAGRAVERLARVSDTRPDNVTGGAPPSHCDGAQTAGGGSMEFEHPKVPSGSGEHPIALVVVSAKNLAAAGKFYSKLFGWQVHPMSPELAGAVAPAGPTAAFRADVPAGVPRVGPPITLRDVDPILAAVVPAGGRERAHGGQAGALQRPRGDYLWAAGLGHGTPDAAHADSRGVQPQAARRRDLPSRNVRGRRRRGGTLLHRFVRMGRPADHAAI